MLPELHVHVSNRMLPHLYMHVHVHVPCRYADYEDGDDAAMESSYAQQEFEEIRR